MTETIIIAGSPRTGSVWLFNVVCALLAEVKGRDHIYGAWVEEYDASRPEPFHVVKMHQKCDVSTWNPRAVFTSHRNLMACVGSAIRVKFIEANEGSVTSFVDYWINNYMYWRNIAEYDMSYDDMLTSPRAVINQISKVLGFSMDASVVDRLASEMADLGQKAPPVLPNSAEYDAQTLLHPGHVGEKLDCYAIGLVPPSVQELIKTRERELHALQNQLGSFIKRESRAKINRKVAALAAKLSRLSRLSRK